MTTAQVLGTAALARWLVDRGEPVTGEVRAAREHRILVALAGTDVPTPGVIGLVDDPLVCDVPVLVVEYVGGLVIDQMEVADGLLPGQRHQVGLGLAGVLARLHAVDPEAVGLSDLSSHSPYAVRQLKRWSRQWEASRTRDLPALDRLTAWLLAHVPEESRPSVVHGDLHVRNVIVDPVTCAVRAALDWELCTLGDPLADLGSTLAYWPEAGDEPIGLFAASRLPGFATRAEIADAYAEGTGADLATVPFWEVLGMWKIAIIAEGVRRRALDEPANAAEGGPAAAHLIDGLVDRALERAGA